MKKYKSTFILAVFLLSLYSLSAQETTTTTTATTQSIAKGLGLFVFPAKGQDQKTQDTDEMECYRWAMDQTQYNPLNPPQIVGAKVDKSVDGSAIGGAAAGAAAGAAIGAIAGDTGKGAAIGAILGGLRGRRAKVYNDQKKQQANDQAATAKQKELLDNFKKAYTACMEAKEYTVK